MNLMLNRRQLLASTGALAAAGSLAHWNAPVARAASPDDFRYCLNTSTIRGQNLPIDQEIELAAKAGYQGIEPWIREIEMYQQNGGSLADLRKRIEDAGLKVESAIGFANWIVDDPAQRAAGLEAARRDMDLVKQIGGTRIAAPPVGATKQTGMDLFAIAERYRALLELGREMEVTPQIELWGFSSTLSRLGELAFVCVEAAHPDACMLPDVYHIYKGGSDFAGLKMIDGAAIHVFHMNDYPANPPRETINDGDRVYPGDGVAPLGQILKQLSETGFRGVLSLELFNREYWKQDAEAVVRTGLQKMRDSVAKALA
ncbi:MAG: sugar phosphate isomerase/epimerase [Planctomycetales bacterium]|nr:sugar phosphate isomerase/epimerase [Planctomycetales bacterium]